MILINSSRKKICCWNLHNTDVMKLMMILNCILYSMQTKRTVCSHHLCLYHFTCFCAWFAKNIFSGCQSPRDVCCLSELHQDQRTRQSLSLRVELNSAFGIMNESWSRRAKNFVMIESGWTTCWSETVLLFVFVTNELDVWALNAKTECQPSAPVPRADSTPTS